MPATTRFSLFDEAQVHNALTDALHVGIDLVPLEGLKPTVRGRIEADMVRAF